MDLMWDDVGVMRTRGQLISGLGKLSDLSEEFLECGLADSNKTFNLTWHDWLNMQSLIAISETIAQAALWRENSRGAHYREDFPESGDMEDSYFTVVRQDNQGDLNVSREAVQFTIVKPGETLLDDDTETLAAV